jgi:putative transposase
LRGARETKWQVFDLPYVSGAFGFLQVVSSASGLGAMPTYIRWRESGATYFFTLVTYKRRELFAGEACRSFLRDAFRRVMAKRPLEMPVSVLLPDHIHCIWRLPDEDDDFPTRWRQIKSAFTTAYLKAGGGDQDVTPDARRQGRRGVWQPRYWEHRIRDEADYDRHRDYIHLNPVKHGRAQEPGEWRWSSFHAHVRAGMLDPGWPGGRAVDLPEGEGYE